MLQTILHLAVFGIYMMNTIEGSTVKSKVICDSTATVACSGSEKLVIKSARYLLFPGPPDGCTDTGNKPCLEEDVSTTFQSHCFDQSSCFLSITWDASCPGRDHVKVLEVNYTCVVSNEVSLMCGFNKAIDSIILHTPGFPDQLTKTSPCVAKIDVEKGTTKSHGLQMQVLTADLPTDVFLFDCQSTLELMQMSSASERADCVRVNTDKPHILHPAINHFPFEWKMGTVGDTINGAPFPNKGILAEFTVIPAFTMCKELWQDTIKQSHIMSPPSGDSSVGSSCKMVIKPSSNDIRLRFYVEGHLDPYVKCGGVLFDAAFYIETTPKTYCALDHVDYWLNFYGDVELTLEIKDMDRIKPFYIEYQLRQNVAVQHTTTSRPKPRSTAGASPQPQSQTLPILLGVILGIVVLAVLVVVAVVMVKRNANNSIGTIGFTDIENEIKKEKLTADDHGLSEKKDRPVSDALDASHPNFKSFGIYKPTFY